MSGNKRGGHEEHENAEAWLLTYADMITLLLALFIYLYSISSINQAKFQAFSQSFAHLFNIGKSPIKGNAGAVPLPGSNKGKADEKAKEKKKFPEKGKEDQEKGKKGEAAAANKEAMDQLKKQLEKDFPELVEQGKLTILEQEEGLMLRLQDTALFALGSRDIQPEARPLLDRMAQMLRTLPNPIRVEGHTDDLPIHSTRYTSNWELSGGRASGVVEYFITQDGIPPGRFSLAGFGEYRPIAPNIPGKGNAANRRVEILILDIKPKAETAESGEADSPATASAPGQAAPEALPPLATPALTAPPGAAPEVPAAAPAAHAPPS